MPRLRYDVADATTFAVFQRDADVFADATR